MKISKILMTLVFSLLFLQNLYSDEVIHLNGVYKIPTQDQSEVAFSTFELIDYKVIKKIGESKQEIFLQYTLPEEMIGHSDYQIELKLVLENGATRVLESDQATALCFGKWDSMNCDVLFKNLDFNFLEIEKKLETSGITNKEKELRLTMLRRFSGDPIGKMEITR